MLWTVLLSLCDQHGDSPLLTACEKGHAAIVGKLIAAGADIEPRTRCVVLHSQFLCHRSLWAGMPWIVLLSLCHQFGHSPLLMACEKGHAAIVDKLIAAGADINAKNKVCCACIPSICAIAHCGLTCLGLCCLLSLCDQHDHSPLAYACMRGHTAIVDKLVAAGADIKAKYEVCCRRPRQMSPPTRN